MKLNQLIFLAVIFSLFSIMSPDHVFGGVENAGKGYINNGSNQNGAHTAEINIPEPLTLEHKELHEELVKATKAGGKTGEAAKEVAKLMHPHFVREEEYALPPLGLLTALAEGKQIQEDEIESVLHMTTRLKEELPLMLKEHKEIVAALENLSTAAQDENRQEYVQFAQKLILHAQTEEEVLYPTSILIGEYIKLKQEN